MNTAIVHVVCLGGLAVYVFVPHPKFSEAGRTVFSWTVLGLVLHWLGCFCR
jgi:hypothetical protein